MKNIAARIPGWAYNNKQIFTRVQCCAALCVVVRILLLIQIHFIPTISIHRDEIYTESVNTRAGGENKQQDDDYTMKKKKKEKMILRQWTWGIK